MDLEKLYLEISHVQEEMAKTSADTEEYRQLTNELLELYRVVTELEKLEIELENSKKEREEAKEKARIEDISSQRKLEEAKYEANIELIKTIFVGSLMMSVAMMTLYAEETRVITSKAWQFATRLLPRI